MSGTRASQQAPLASTKSANRGPTLRRRGKGWPVVVAGAGILALSSLLPGTPAMAQLRADSPSVQTPMGRAPLTFADIVERVKPAVVSISVTGGNARVARNQRGGGGGGGSPLPDLPEDHPLNEFFKNLPKGGGAAPQPRPTQSQGSGFVISADGYVVTNNHVIDGASKIQVTFDDGEKLEADLVGTDSRTDIALLKLKSSKTFKFVKFANGPGRVGDWVVAVGNPFGLGGTVTVGILSANSRDIGSGPYDFIQIDAAVNRGNSGGPTFNLDGEVIGVNTAIYSPSGGNVGIAFAVPTKTATAVIEQLKSSGSVSRGWLGVKIQNIDDDTAASIGLAEAKGALISEVTPNGPAAAAGLKTQDAILQVDGTRIADSRELARKVAEFAPNTSVDVRIWRSNAEQVVKVKLGLFPRSPDEVAKLEQPAKPQPTGTRALEQLGLKLSTARGTGANQDGVAIAEVETGSDAATKGLKAGDRILEVAGQAVSSVDDVVSGVKRAVDLGRRAVLLHVRSGDQKRFVAVQVKKS
jgi:serine protease Do